MAKVRHVYFTSTTYQTHLLGFPPPDDEVRDFLTSNQCYDEEEIKDSSYIRARRFLKALFETTVTTLADLGVPDEVDRTPSEGGASDRANVMTAFRIFMSEGQIMGSSGPKRRKYYHNVVSAASQVDPIFLSVFCFDSLALF